MSGAKNLKSFMYFAYGSNLLSKRIHIQNPSAKRFAIGKLEGYRLDFSTYSKRWEGASATIVEDNAAAVWGSIWEIDICHLQSLDNQEGVHLHIYKPLTKEIETPHGEIIECRIYQQMSNPEDGLPVSEMPKERMPSMTYLQTIQHGAVESELPEEYLSFLNSIPHNGREASPEIMANLNR